MALARPVLAVELDIDRVHLLRIAEGVHQHEVDNGLQPSRRIGQFVILSLRHTGTDHDGTEQAVAPETFLIFRYGRDAHHRRRPQPNGIIALGDILGDFNRFIEGKLLDHASPARLADEMHVEAAHLCGTNATARRCRRSIVIGMTARIDGIRPLAVERDGTIAQVIVLGQLAGKPDLDLSDRGATDLRAIPTSHPDRGIPSPSRVADRTRELRPLDMQGEVVDGMPTVRISDMAVCGGLGLLAPSRYPAACHDDRIIVIGDIDHIAGHIPAIHRLRRQLLAVCDIMRPSVRRQRGCLI